MSLRACGFGWHGGLMVSVGNTDFADVGTGRASDEAALAAAAEAAPTFAWVEARLEARLAPMPASRSVAAIVRKSAVRVV
jgi:hypothetical protein